MYSSNKGKEGINNKRQKLRCAKNYNSLQPCCTFFHTSKDVFKYLVSACVSRLHIFKAPKNSIIELVRHKFPQSLLYQVPSNKSSHKGGITHWNTKNKENKTGSFTLQFVLMQFLSFWYMTCIQGSSIVNKSIYLIKKGVHDHYLIGWCYRAYHLVSANLSHSY